MFNISSDILNIILAVSIVALTTVLVVFFIYLINILRQVNKVLKELAGMGKIFLFLKKKVDHGASHLGLIAEAVKHIVMHFIGEKIEIKKKGKKK